MHAPLNFEQAKAFLHDQQNLKAMQPILKTCNLNFKVRLEEGFHFLVLPGAAGDVLIDRQYLDAMPSNLADLTGIASHLCWTRLKDGTLVPPEFDLPIITTEGFFKSAAKGRYIPTRVIRRVQDNDQPRGYHLVAQPSPEFWPEIYRSAQSSSSPRISIHPAYVGNGTLDEKAMPMTVLPYAIPPKRWYKAEQRPLEILGSQEERCSSMSDSATASNSAGAGQSPEGAAAEEEEAGEGGGEEGDGQGDDGGPSEDEAEAGGEGDEGGHSEDEGKAGSEGEGVERDSDDADEAAVEGLITASTDDIEDPADIPSAPVFPAIDVARLYERDQAWWTAFGAGNRAPQFLRLRPGKIVNMYLGEGIKDEHKQILRLDGYLPVPDPATAHVCLLPIPVDEVPTLPSHRRVVEIAEATANCVAVSDRWLEVSIAKGSQEAFEAYQIRLA